MGSRAQIAFGGGESPRSFKEWVSVARRSLRLLALRLGLAAAPAATTTARARAAFARERSTPESNSAQSATRAARPPTSGWSRPDCSAPCRCSIAVPRPSARARCRHPVSRPCLASSTPANATRRSGSRSRRAGTPTPGSTPCPSTPSAASERLPGPGGREVAPTRRPGLRARAAATVGRFGPDLARSGSLPGHSHIPHGCQTRS